MLRNVRIANRVARAEISLGEHLLPSLFVAHLAHGAAHFLL